MCSPTLRIAFLFVALGVTPAHAQPYYSLQNGSGQQFLADQIRGYPNVDPYSLFSHGPPTRTMFPPLLIPRNTNANKQLVKQTAGPDPKRITVPPGVFRRPTPGAQSVLGIAPLSSLVFQVRTRLSLSGPAPALGSAVLKAGGRTGAAVTTYSHQSFGSIRYSKTAAQFGGPMQTRVLAASPIRLWAHNKAATAPCKHPKFGGSDTSCVALLLDHHPGPLVAAGAPIGFTATTPGGPQPTPQVVAVSVPKATGLVAMSAEAACSACFSNMATFIGFPWTTGRITISHSTALGGASVFTIAGMDSRVNGVGALSLVSGALSNRTSFGPEAIRGWTRFTVPEPGAALGAATALAMLAVCHAMLRGRR